MEIAKLDLSSSATVFKSTHHLFFPPSTASGIPLRINNAPSTPYAGSMTMLNGIQSSPSCHTSVSFAFVEFVDVSFPFSVPFSKDDEFVLEDELRVRVKVMGRADDAPDAWGMKEVITVVMTI